MNVKSKELTHWNKKQRRNNKIKLFLALALSGIFVFNAQYITAFIVIALLYVLHEVLWSDHVFYDPQQDYAYHLNSTFSETIELSDKRVLWQDKYQHKTLFLEVELQSQFSGIIFDPYVELLCGDVKQRQYFERGLNGKRFINMSHINNDAADSIVLNTLHCKIKNATVVVHGFEKPQLSEQKILIIAPHADDAEIAAYGLYSDHNCFITTITAGEVEADYYETGVISPAEASQLKGRLRAWDSIAVPQWAGKNASQTLQLGYFCLTLEQMKLNPEKNVTSLTAAIAAPDFFRKFNQLSPGLSPLHSRKEANWDALLSELSVIIKHYQPDIICTAHPLLDPHSDHYYSTLAVLEACEISGIEADYLLYANHNNHTDLSPFGLSGSLASLAPEFAASETGVALYSNPLSRKKQIEKRCALAMMHDLNTPISLKKKFRKKLQTILLGREKFNFLFDDFFRKAVRQNEIFYHVNQQQLKQLIAEK